MSTSTPINFSGLASGLDTSAIVTGLVNIEKIPLTQIQNQEQDVSAASQTITGLASSLASLKAAATALSTPAQFTSFKVSSSDTAVVASVSGAAQTGAVDVSVSSLAHEQRTYSDVQSSSSAALGMAGQLSIQIGSGAATNLSIASTDTLTDVAAKISSSGARVSAAVIFDGTNYLLQVRGLDTGAANAITFGESGFSLGLSKPANTVQAASDAHLTVDGLPITRSTNQVVGVIPGVTLALTKVTSSPVTVQVDPDESALATKISSLVAAYNSAVSLSHSATGYGQSQASTNELAGDSSITLAMNRVAGSLAGNIAGTSGKYTTLSSIGVTSNNDGTLTLDESALTQALAADPNAVSKLFVNDPATGSVGAMTNLMSTVDAVATNANSVLTTRLNSLTSMTKNLQSDADEQQRHLDQYQAMLQKQFSDMEVLVSQYKSQMGAVTGLGSGSSTG